MFHLDSANLIFLCEDAKIDMISKRAKVPDVYCLWSVMLKVLKKIILKKLIPTLQNKGIGTYNQFDFREQNSIIKQVYRIIERKMENIG